MESVRVDFERRVAEIEVYFRHLSAGTTDGELEKVLKANVFLLLYNLVESTVRQALIAISDSVAQEKLTYAEVQSEIKRLWIRDGHRNFQQLGTEAIFDRIGRLPADVVNLKFDPKIATGGNLDARKIRTFAEEYGFSSTAHYRAKDGIALFTIKKRRNDLAHGLESFAECGRQYTVPELEGMKRETIVYLRSILRNVAKYLENGHYRNAQPP